MPCPEETYKKDISNFVDETFSILSRKHVDLCRYTPSSSNGWLSARKYAIIIRVNNHILKFYFFHRGRKWTHIEFKPSHPKKIRHM